MVWMMILPNYLISFHFIEGRFQSAEYVNLLKEKVLSVIMLNFGKDVFFQQDNAFVCQSKTMQTFLKESKIPTMLLLAKSPDFKRRGCLENDI